MERGQAAEQGRPASVLAMTAGRSPNAFHALAETVRPLGATPGPEDEDLVRTGRLPPLTLPSRVIAGGCRLARECGLVAATPAVSSRAVHSHRRNLYPNLGVSGRAGRNVFAGRPGRGSGD